MKKFYFVMLIIALCSMVGCDDPKAGGGTVSPDATESYIIDAVLCTAIENNSPVSITNIFLPKERVNLWIHWANVRTGQTVTTTWHEPNGSKVGENTITFQGREDRQISISYVDLNNTTTHGEWLVKVFLDGKLMRSYLFVVN